MADLKSLGREYHAEAKAHEATMSRSFTPNEEQRLMEALQEIVDMGDITMHLVDESPYANENELRHDVLVNKRFQTPLLDCGDMMSRYTYTFYRMAHDIRNHVLQNKSFSPFDELLSAFDLTHALEGKVSDYTLDFIFTDVLLMNSVYAYSPSKWRKLENGKHHHVCCMKSWQSSKLLLPSKA